MLVELSRIIYRQVGVGYCGLEISILARKSRGLALGDCVKILLQGGKPDDASEIDRRQPDFLTRSPFFCFQLFSKIGGWMGESGLPLALVTGAARRVGRAVAFALAQEGYAIGLHYFHSHPEAEETAAAIIASTAAPVYLLPADLSNPEQIEDMFERVVALPHQLAVLVNSAAEMKHGDLREMPVEAWDFTFDLNLRAPWLCSRAAARLMGPEGGTVINLSDSGAGKAWTSYPAYSISKSALETLTRLLARALAPSVRVNAVAPGLILPSPELSAEAWERLVERLPLHEAGQPEDIARAVLFFVRNPYVTGQVLAVDGGYQLL
jgi:NAD(P)-dependent dehydrogenase (short-subunit alcohol dehydrogenase family)